MDRLIELMEQYSEYKGQDLTEEKWELIENLSKIKINKTIKSTKISQDMGEEELEEIGMLKLLKKCNTKKDYERFFEKYFCDIKDMNHSQEDYGINM
jgi:hypothetical protein